MKALIIGLGYLGSAVAKIWEEAGLEISVTTSTPERVRELKKQFKDVYLASDLENACKDQELIFVAIPPENEVAEKLQKQARSKVIWISSTSVYKENSGNTVDEESPTNGGVIARSEAQILAIPNSVVLRLGEITGPGREHLEKLERLQSKTLPGDGESIVNVSPLPIILEAIELIRIKNASGVFNVCSDHHPTRLELYSKLAAQHSLKLPTYDPTLPSKHISKKIVDSSKLHQLSVSD